MPPLAVDRGVVVKRLVGVLPRPPLALDVVRVGDRPVRRAGQGDARHGAVLADHPDVARRPVEVHVPDLLRLRDEVVVGALLPARHRLRTADDRRPFAPGRVAGQDDGGVRRARLIRVHLAAVVYALLEDVGLHRLAGRRLAAGVGVPGVVLPGRLLREAVVGVVAGLEVDVADRLARLELEGLRRPLQIAGRQHLRLRLLPGPPGHVLSIHYAVRCNQQGQHGNAAVYSIRCDHTHRRCSLPGNKGGVERHDLPYLFRDASSFDGHTAASSVDLTQPVLSGWTG